MGTVVGRESPLASYRGRHAELYDLFYADKPYEQEAAFVHSRIQEFGVGPTSRLLELACGTGSHALILERFGYQITAIDYSRDMLERAQEKAMLARSKVEFRQHDMRAVPAAEKPYDVVVCLFDSLGYVATNEALQQVFDGVHRLLRRDGLFIFEFWHAAAMLRSYDPVRVRRWHVDSGEILRISETQLEPSKQLATVTYHIYELNKDGTFTAFTESQVNRYFLVQEMAVWLSANHFTAVKWFAGFEENKPIDQEAWHVLAVARSQ